jgi:hypothetical protein
VAAPPVGAEPLSVSFVVVAVLTTDEDVADPAALVVVDPAAVVEVDSSPVLVDVGSSELDVEAPAGPVAKKRNAVARAAAAAVARIR